LANLTSVGGSIAIYQNPALTNLDGLANLTSVGGYLHIIKNTAITNLNGLANLTSVGGYLYINNTAITNLDELANLTSVEGFISISSNPALTNLDGLANLTSVGGDLHVRYNGNLNACAGIALLLGWPDGPPNDHVTGSINIDSCDSIDAILNSLEYVKPTIDSILSDANSLELNFAAAMLSPPLYSITGYEAACTGLMIPMSEAPELAITDNTAFSRVLTIAGYPAIMSSSRVEIDLDIAHERPEQLLITLTSPVGTTVTLWDKSTQSTTNIAGSFPASYMPSSDLGVLATENMNGDWVLTIEDVVAGALVSEGVLNKWGIRITEARGATGSASPILVTGVVTDREYSCSVAPVFAGVARSASIPVLATPTPDSDDSDNDGVLNVSDAFPLIGIGDLTDTDGDGRPNDCDNACATLGMAADPDDDNDGLSDDAELNVHGTNPLLADTDGDSMDDGQELDEGLNPLDATDCPGWYCSSSKVYLYKIAAERADSDRDGLTNKVEKSLGTNPNVADSDADGLSDGLEVNTYSTDPLVADTDGDGLSDGSEVNTYGTQPLISDTDGDSVDDGEEIQEGLDPLVEDCPAWICGASTKPWLYNI